MVYFIINFHFINFHCIESDILINLDNARLDHFKLEQTLKNGSKLLSSDTHKYEIKESDLADSSDYTKANQNNVKSENIKQQRQLLVSKLGIDVGGAANLDTTHLFTDEDLIMSVNTPNGNNNNNSVHMKRKLTSEIKEEV